MIVTYNLDRNLVKLVDKYNAATRRHKIYHFEELPEFTKFIYGKSNYLLITQVNCFVSRNYEKLLDTKELLNINTNCNCKKCMKIFNSSELEEIIKKFKVK